VASCLIGTEGHLKVTCGQSCGSVSEVVEERDVDHSWEVICGPVNRGNSDDLKVACLLAIASVFKWDFS